MPPLSMQRLLTNVPFARTPPAHQHFASRMIRMATDHGGDDQGGPE